MRVERCIRYQRKLLSNLSIVIFANGLCAHIDVASRNAVITGTCSDRSWTWNEWVQLIWTCLQRRTGLELISAFCILARYDQHEQ